MGEVVNAAGHGPLGRRAVVVGAGASILSLFDAPLSRAELIEPISSAEKLLYATVRITGKNKQGKDTGGTGFFYKIGLENNQQTVVVITNEHVVRDVVGGVDVSVHTKTTSGTGAPDGTSSIHLDGVLGSEWIEHPNKIDLCAYPIQPRLNSMVPPCFLTFVDKSLIPSQQAIQDLDAIEEVVNSGLIRELPDSRCAQ